MQTLARISNADHQAVNPHRFVKVLTAAVIVLLFTTATAIGSLTIITNESNTDVEIDSDSNDSEDRNQAVAMKIDVDDDDVLDLDMARGDVVVDTWDGNDVLVIVEKAKPSAGQPTSLNIQVTRRGNSVRIATLDMMGQPFSHPNLSLRIMVPKKQIGASNVSSIYDLSKLTSVVFHALRGEAIKWVGR